MKLAIIPLGEKVKIEFNSVLFAANIAFRINSKQTRSALRNIFSQLWHRL